MGSLVRAYETMIFIDTINDFYIARNFTLYSSVRIALHLTFGIEFLCAYLDVTDRTSNELDFLVIS